MVEAGTASERALHRLWLGVEFKDEDRPSSDPSTSLEGMDRRWESGEVAAVLLLLRPLFFACLPGVGTLWLVGAG